MRKRILGDVVSRALAQSATEPPDELAEAVKNFLRLWDAGAGRDLLAVGVVPMRVALEGRTGPPPAKS
jgi:hypothetical protein